MFGNHDLGHAHRPCKCMYTCIPWHLWPRSLHLLSSFHSTSWKYSWSAPPSGRLIHWLARTQQMAPQIWRLTPPLPTGSGGSTVSTFPQLQSLVSAAPIRLRNVFRQECPVKIWTNWCGRLTCCENFTDFTFKKFFSLFANLPFRFPIPIPIWLGDSVVVLSWYFAMWGAEQNLSCCWLLPGKLIRRLVVPWYTGVFRTFLSWARP